MDQKDLLILTLLYQNPGTSLGEIRDAILVHSIAAAYYRVRSLEARGYILPPPHRKMARSRRVSPLGVQLLKESQMI